MLTVKQLPMCSIEQSGGMGRGKKRRGAIANGEVRHNEGGRVKERLEVKKGEK